jgi:hypothetical protein
MKERKTMSKIAIKLVRHDNTYEDICHSEDRTIGRVKSDFRRFSKMSEVAHLSHFIIHECDEHWKMTKQHRINIKSQ